MRKRDWQSRSLKLAAQRRWFACVVFIAAFVFAASVCQAEMRFPPPEFDSGYAMPKTQNPITRALLLQYLDVIVLAAGLVFTSWVVHRKRSRKWIVGIAAFSVLYFGFYREGCVCAIGSIQNVALGLCNSSYAVPAGVLAFFALPLATALFFGRSFCAGVCPHGALQDLVLLKPVKIPGWLEQGLGVIPFIYLGLAVLFAATGSAFIICEFDPFIPLFRLSGSATALALGAGFLVAGVFIGRPYCRFLCPYGALLRLTSAFSKWRVRITPDTCTQCTLCAESCPFGVIREPAVAPVSARGLAAGRRRLAWSVVALPLFIAIAALAGNRFALAAARKNPDVRLAEMYAAGQAGSTRPLDSKDKIALTRAEQTHEELVARAETARHRIQTGGWVLGGWIGLVLGVKLLGLASTRRRKDFEPDRSGCFACARCFLSCPQERTRLGLEVAVASPLPAATVSAAKVSG